MIRMPIQHLAGLLGVASFFIDHLTGDSDDVVFDELLADRFDV